MTYRPTPPDQIKTPTGIGIPEGQGAAEPQPLRPSPMGTTSRDKPPAPIPDHAVVSEWSHGGERPKLGPLASFKRLLLDLYGNGNGKR